MSADAGQPATVVVSPGESDPDRPSAAALRPSPDATVATPASLADVPIQTRDQLRATAAQVASVERIELHDISSLTIPARGHYSINARLYTPEPRRRPLVVFAHDGSWISGDLDTHDFLVRRISRDTGAIVLAGTTGSRIEHAESE